LDAFDRDSAASVMGRRIALLERVNLLSAFMVRYALNFKWSKEGLRSYRSLKKFSIKV
jgi:hypothetical protein